MAHLWLRDDDASGWHAAPLRAESYALGAGQLVPSPLDADVAAGVAELHDVAGLWVLLAPESVQVSGSPVVGGVRVLRDLDEIRIGATRAFFSTAEVPRVESFAGDPVPCGRCRVPLAPGDSAVRSRCGVWHHQSEDLPCWTHVEHCSQCDQPTALDAPLPWSPEML